jgi:hypothetical protein
VLEQRECKSLLGVTDLRFLLASFQLKYVLRETGQRNMRKALDTLPLSELDAYHQIITRIKEASRYTCATAFRTLSWIFHAARPLKMAELREALAVHESVADNEDIFDLGPTFEEDYVAADILESCQSLVVYEESGGVVRFTHPSVQDFLKTQFVPNIPEANFLSPCAELGKACLTYLGFDVFKKPCSDWRIYKDVSCNTNQFSNHAFTFWSRYCRGDAEEEPNIRMAILEVLASSAWRSWMGLFESESEQPAPFLSYSVDGVTILHLLARYGLASVIRFHLNEKRSMALNQS